MKSAQQMICLGAVLCLLLLCGCQKQGLYYWGDYSETYYAYAQSPGEETLAAHLASLDKIIEMSGKKNRAVPPGVYGEYGYYMLKAGKTELAVSMFRKEEALYPESHVFMDRLIASAESDENTPDNPENAAEVAQDGTRAHDEPNTPAAN
ncbi:DUF4810 domain-containing protein [Desulfocurvus sp. DL9XJH121]